MSEPALEPIKLCDQRDLYLCSSFAVAAKRIVSIKNAGVATVNCFSKGVHPQTVGDFVGTPSTKCHIVVQPGATRHYLQTAHYKKRCRVNASLC